MVGYIIATLLQIVCRVCQRKNFENRLIQIGEDMAKSKVPRLLLVHPAEKKHTKTDVFEEGRTKTQN